MAVKHKKKKIIINKEGSLFRICMAIGSGYSTGKQNIKYRKKKNILLLLDQS